jgi:DNA polymerase beta
MSSKKRAIVVSDSDTDVSSEESLSDSASDSDQSSRKKKSKATKPVKRAAKPAKPAKPHVVMDSKVAKQTDAVDSKPAAATATAATKAPKAVNLNENITSYLFKLAAKERTSGDMQKSMVFIKAANALRAHPKKVESGKEAQELKGIGPKIALIVDEILQTGGLARIDGEIAAAKNDALQALTSVYGINEDVATELFTKHKISSVMALQQYVQSHAEQISEAVKMGLKYHVDFARRIARRDVESLSEYVRRTLLSLDSRYEAVVCGDYRLGAAECDEVVVVISHPDLTIDSAFDVAAPHSCAHRLQSMVNKLQADQFLIDSIAQTPVSYYGVCRLPAEPVQALVAPVVQEAAPRKRFAIPSLKASTEASAAPEISTDMFKPGSVFGSASVELPSPTPVIAVNPSVEPATAPTELPSTRRLARRIMLHMVPWQSRACSAIYHTGSPVFVKQLIQHAEQRGFTFDEIALRKANVVVSTPTEADLFQAIGMDFVAVENR